MKTNLVKTLFGTALATACACAMAVPVQAGTLWNYSWDSFKDGSGDLTQNGGTGGHGVGLKSNFEMFGMAYVEDLVNDTVTFAFNSNIHLDGWKYNGVQNGTIAWGDLFLNLNPDKTFEQVKGTSDLLAIRFSSKNDSGVTGGETGIFSGVTTKNVTSTNSGYSSYNQYNKYVTDKKGTVELIDGMTLAESQAYLGTHGHSVINTYQEKLGNITLLDVAQLSTLGLDFSAQAAKDGLGTVLGTQTFGFSFARSLLPQGELSWIAHVLAECANDTMGMMGTFADNTPVEPEAVPEPASLLGLTLGAAALVGAKRRQQTA
ncbi:PEP-CTERM sorting domain-containing protein [Spirulina subsalsa FACHB-351]|uniref:PEP-CTERM sorting domain-containing protein n=1 Tax=Spirulina subsalsa FACHB-351 TaxID=234711 RepID=A0ABT3LB14_9CYAN|nr:PEP-CTERM sorting domain-containing protein [Spirulina subsalsa]MCW6038704.1 PEP-CTERM sorting domain-containing protein [Spirulina subsalsa FACHB-351]